MSQWSKCGRCGFSFPLSQLITQKGLLVCPKDIDNLDIEYRPKVIAEILADTEETSNEMQQVFDDPNSIEF